MSSSVDPAPTTVIRPGRRGELHQVAGLLGEAFAELRVGFPWPDLWTTYYDDVVAVQERWDTSLLLVAEVDGGVAGSVDYYPPGGGGYHLRDAVVDGIGAEAAEQTNWPATAAAFRCLATRPSMRGTGIARALVRRVLDLAVRDGATHVGLHTLPTMRAAVALYESLGFDRLPERDMHIDPARPDRVLAFELSLG